MGVTGPGVNRHAGFAIAAYMSSKAIKKAGGKTVPVMSENFISCFDTWNFDAIWTASRS